MSAVYGVCAPVSPREDPVWEALSPLWKGTRSMLGIMSTMSKVLSELWDVELEEREQSSLHNAFISDKCIIFALKE
jgi:hypothetical protein